MKTFKKLSRAEMKKVKGGQGGPPNCTVGSACYDAHGARGQCATGPIDQPCRCIVGSI